MAEHPVGELDQRRLGRALLGELGVEDLLAGPGGFAEGLQPDHPRAALERVEGAPQRRQQAEVAGRVLQAAAHAACASSIDLARFLEEDLAHLVVVLEVADAGRSASSARSGAGSLDSARGRPARSRWRRSRPAPPRARRARVATLVRIVGGARGSPPAPSAPRPPAPAGRPPAPRATAARDRASRPAAARPRAPS